MQETAYSCESWILTNDEYVNECKDQKKWSKRQPKGAGNIVFNNF